MGKIQKLFGETKMSWPVVLLFAFITGIYTGGINSIPFLKDTSFQDIAISYEWWVVFALIVVTNCKKPLEAAAKCFMFFLISQPLVYLIEMLFAGLSFSDASYYYIHIWLPMTILTLPGGFIAYFSKKQNIIGSIILGLGETILGILGVHYAMVAFTNFPRHILSAVFCFASIIMTALFIQKENRNRVITLIISLGLTAAVIIFALLSGRTL